MSCTRFSNVCSHIILAMADSGLNIVIAGRMMRMRQARQRAYVHIHRDSEKPNKHV